MAMLIILFIIVPESIGLLISKFTKRQDNLILNLIIGFIIEFAIMQIISIPMIFLKKEFHTLAELWFKIMIILSVLGIVINIKECKNIFLNVKENLKKIPIILTIIAVVLVLFQTYKLARYAHIDDDDAFYVATATVTVQKDTMYLSCAEDGGYYGKFPARYVLSPFPMYTATISYFTNIHPAYIAHTIFPIVFIPLAYMVIALLGYKLFNKDTKSTILFLIISSFLCIYGNYSIRNNFTFLLFRIWQGKAILANILLPFSWYCFMECMNKNKFINWLILMITTLASCFVSSMGIALIPISTFIFSIIYAIKDKKLNYVIKSFITLIPCFIYASIYLYIR